MTLDEEVTIEAYAVTDSTIMIEPTAFGGIYLFHLTIGNIGTRHSTIFTVENGGHRLIVLYSGICPVLKNDNLRITGKMKDGKNAGIQGEVMKASCIEIIDTGDIYHK
nr:hypothetical protein [uncultured Methanolobus sp.]